MKILKLLIITLMVVALVPFIYLALFGYNRFWPFSPVIVLAGETLDYLVLIACACLCAFIWVDFLVPRPSGDWRLISAKSVLFVLALFPFGFATAYFMLFFAGV